MTKKVEDMSNKELLIAIANKVGVGDMPTVSELLKRIVDLEARINVLEYRLDNQNLPINPFYPKVPPVIYQTEITDEPGWTNKPICSCSKKIKKLKEKDK